MTGTLSIPLEGSLPPGHEILLVRDDNRPFALVGRWAGGGALVGSEPVQVASPEDDPFNLLGTMEPSQPTPAKAGENFVGGGWFGYLGYGLGVPGQDRVIPPPANGSTRNFSLARYDHLLRLDSEDQWWFEALLTPEREDLIRKRLTTLGDRLKEGVAPPTRFATRPWHSDPSPEGHARAVEACRERIAAGDLYQANITLRLGSELDGDPADLFARAAGQLAPDRAAFFRDGQESIASLSPELFLERRGQEVISAPIKGTRAREADPAADARARSDLAGSEKDLAENTMIVDLVRNDLGRVCLPGTVEVTTLAAPRAHSGVWHLVSEVTGELPPGTDDAELLAATFPPGSVTGAPKLAALAAIASLESSPRQVFTGAIGFSSPFAGLELNVAIRTFEICGPRIWLDVGGGIVADSDPFEEANEAIVKARPLLDSIGASLQGQPPASSAPPVLRLGSRPVSRPDPGEGIFETLLVRDGSAVDLDLHWARMRSSALLLYKEELASEAGTGILKAAGAAEGPCRLRIDFIPGRGITLETTPLPVLKESVRLVPVTVPGGVGCHKWRDRRLLDALSSATAPATALLVDLDGYVLEATWANVFIAGSNGELATPPNDGRILPGVGREQVLRRFEGEGRLVSERPVSLEELNWSSEVFLVNALRGIVPVAGQAGKRLPT